jgi:hypothetical protein
VYALICWVQRPVPFNRSAIKKLEREGNQKCRHGENADACVHCSGALGKDIAYVRKVAYVMVFLLASGSRLGCDSLKGRVRQKTLPRNAAFKSQSKEV